MNRVIAFGEIMGRLAAPGYKRFCQAMPGSLNVSFAGAEASIASSIAYLGGNAAFVTALPAHALGDACIATLKALGVDTRFIVRTETGRLGLYFLETGANQRPGNIIYDRENSSVAITPASAYDWPRILEGAAWLVLSGITPAISLNGFEVTQRAMEIAHEQGVRIAFDMNYRSKLWRWDPALTPRQLATKTMRQLMPLVDLFVGGREDVEAMLDRTDAPSLETLARETVVRYPRLSLVAMTIRESISASHNHFGGLLYESKSDRFFYGPSENHLYPITHIVDRIGTGDAFTAGLLFSLITPARSHPDSAIRFAAAAGCLSHSIEGDFNCSTLEEIDALVAGQASGRVNR